MRIRIHYHGLEHSQWLDQLIMRKVCSLKRYLSPSATTDVLLITKGEFCQARICVFSLKHNFEFLGEGEIIYEALSNAHDQATRILSEFKRKKRSRVIKRIDIDVA